MPKDVLEASKATLTAKVVRGKSKSLKAKFHLYRDGTEFAAKDATVAGDKASCEIDSLPEVNPGQEKYKLTYKVKVDEEESEGDDFYWVWPRKVKVTAVDKAKKPLAGIPFVFTHGGVESKPHHTGDKGSFLYIMKDAGAFTVDAKSPYKVVKWTKKSLRDLEAEVKAEIEAEFFAPAPPADKSAIQQWVNLTSTTEGQDGKSNEVTIEVGAKGDKPKAVADRAGKRGNMIFIEVRFGRQSKRNNPEPKLSGAEEIQKLEDGKLYKGKVTLASDGASAKFKVDLGVAGGDTCEIKIGGTDKVGDATLKFENWRQLWYQVTRPKDAAVPSMDRETAALKEVFIKYEKYKDLEVPEDDGPAGSWFDASWFGGAGKWLNIGDHNKAHFHGKFDDTHTPLGVHVACCHKQYDCNDVACEQWFLDIEVEKTNTVKWSDASNVVGIKKDIDKLFPKSLKDGTDSFMEGTWTEVGGAGTGNLTAADVWIQPNSITVKLPAAAKAVVDAGAGKKVKLKFKVFIPKGPYLGESDGTNGYNQLIVIKMHDTTVNDVMAHELGHTLNQVVKSAPSGLAEADHGRKYAVNGHQGPHCADGMSTDNYAGGAGKAGTSYHGNFAGKSECKCIMYGENNPAGSGSTGKFCNRCKKFLKAEQLSTLH